MHELLIWHTFKRKCILNGYIDIHPNGCADIVQGMFLVGVQLHQWFCFGSYLFALVIDNLTAEAQDEVC